MVENIRKLGKNPDQTNIYESKQTEAEAETFFSKNSKFKSSL